MKVCYFLPTLDYATGWGRWSIDLLETIVAHGVEPVLVVPASQRDLHAKMDIRHETHFWGPEPYLSFHQLHWLNLRGLKDLFSLKRHYGLLKGRGISLIHTGDIYPWGVFAAQLREAIGAPVILTNHSRLLFNPAFSLIDLRLCRSCVAAADKVVSVSAWASSQVQKGLGMEGEKFMSVGNGVNIERHKHFADVGNGVGGIQPAGTATGPVLLSVTRFMRLKGIETSIMAFRKVKEEMPGARYYVVGPHTDRKYLNRIRRLIDDHGIMDVYLPGKVEDVSELANYYRAADVLVHTSRWESFPLVFFEAGLYGVPVVAADVGGVGEAVTDGENGLLVPPGDVETTVAALRKLLSDAALARRLGDNNRKRALENTTRRLASDYYKIYTEIIKDKGGLT
jgi:glycosyltransferase involved in cell wall biosynthesis